MNKALLKSIMMKHGDTVKDLAEYLCLSCQSVYNKMNETKMASGKKAEFGQHEIRMIRKKYKLTADEIELVFFN